MAEMAMQRGWWQYARHKAQEMESQHPSLYSGLRAEVAKIIKESGFRLDHEEANWDWKND